MNKKILVLMITVIAVALIATPMIGTAMAGSKKNTFVVYEYKANVGHDIEVTYYEQIGPLMILEAYRTDEGKADGEITVTINDVVYEYPEDIDVDESFHLEFNFATNEGLARVETIITFVNLPGKPEIIDFAVSKALGDGIYEGIVSIAGTRMFRKVEGNGWDETLQGDEVDIVYHVAAIKGWRFD